MNEPLNVEAPSYEVLLDRTARRLGYPGLFNIPQQIFEVLQPAVAELLAVAEPVAVVRTVPLESVGAELVVVGGLEIASAKWAEVSRRLELPGVAAFCALTLGPRIDERLEALRAESLSAAYILDAAASEAVELCADATEDAFWSKAGFEGYGRTRRFSPGYCDWPLEAQGKIFEFLEPGRIGMRLTKAFAMLPAKSITAVVLGARAVPLKTPCPLCDEADCPDRRTTG